MRAFRVFEVLDAWMCCVLSLGMQMGTSAHRSRGILGKKTSTFPGRLCPKILAVAEFARIQTNGNCLNSGEFSYAEICQDILAHPRANVTSSRDAHEVALPK